MEATWIMAGVAVLAVVLAIALASVNFYAFRCLARIGETRADQHADDCDRMSKMLGKTLDAALAINGAELARMRMQTEADFTGLRVDSLREQIGAAIPDEPEAPVFTEEDFDMEPVDSKQFDRVA